MRADNKGFTLLELVAVITLIAIIAALSATRMGSVQIWKQKSDIRKLVDIIELLSTEAVVRQHAYRLIIDLDDNSYRVRREVRLSGSKKVDYLKNLRLKSEQERLRQQEESEMLGVSEELAEEDRRQSEPLEQLFYSFMFDDPGSAYRLARPIEFPKLAQRKYLTDGLRILDLETARGKINSGEILLRFSPSGGELLAVLHFQAGTRLFTAKLNPAFGHVTIVDGVISFEEAFKKHQKHAA